MRSDLPPGVSTSSPASARWWRSHCLAPLVDMGLFTGSTRAGKRVMQAGVRERESASPSTGGKSPNVILEDADLNAAVPPGWRRLH